MLKSLCSIGLVCLFVSANCQAFPQPITFTTKAVPTRQVLQELSKQAGVKLEATNEMQDEPLIVRLNKVPLKKAMDEIAAIFDADWVDHHGYWQLERSSDKRAEIRRGILEKREKAIQHSYQELQKRQDEIPALNSESADALVKGLYEDAKKRAAGGDTDDQKEMDMQSRLPWTRLTRSIVLSMDPSELAAIQTNRRVVFATSPNALQRPLRDLPSKAFTDFNAEMTLLNASFQKVVPQQDHGLLNELTQPGKGPLARIVVASQPFPHDETLHLQFHFLDAQSQDLATDSQDLGTTIEDWMGNQKDYATLRQAAQKEGFPLGPVGQEIAPRTGQHQPGEWRRLSTEAEYALLHPVEQDPLSLATSDIILTSAQKAGENAICLATDETEFYALNSGRLGKTSLAAFETIAEKQCGMTFTEADGWLIGKPTDPLDAEVGRMPRPLLQSFIQEAAKEGFISIDNAANLCEAAPIDANLMLSSEYSHFLVPEGILETLDSDPDILRLIGSLSPVQRHGAAKGSITLRVGDLSAEQKGILQRWAFDGFNPLEQGDSSFDAIQNVQNQERTDFYPKGLPDDVEILVTDVSEPVFFVRETNFGGGSYDMSLPGDALASAIADSQHPELSSMTNPSRLDKLSKGIERTVSIRLVSGSKSMDDVAREEHRPTGEMQTIDQFLTSLPSDEREKIDAAVAAILDREREHRSNRPASGPAPASEGGGVKPPA